MISVLLTIAPADGGADILLPGHPEVGDREGSRSKAQRRSEVALLRCVTYDSRFEA